MALTLIIANRPRCKPRAEAGGWHKMGGATVWEGINRGEWGWGGCRRTLWARTKKAVKVDALSRLF